jgi:hypothetical protein
MPHSTLNKTGLVVDARQLLLAECTKLFPATEVKNNLQITTSLQFTE